MRIWLTAGRNMDALQIGATEERPVTDGVQMAVVRYIDLGQPAPLKRAKGRLIFFHMRSHIRRDFPALLQRPVFLKGNRHKRPRALHISPALADLLMPDKIIQRMIRKILAV